MLSLHENFLTYNFVCTYPFCLCVKFVGILHYLLEDEDVNSMISLEEYLSLYEDPYDVVLESGTLPVVSFENAKD